MSKNAAALETPQETPPPFDPDPDLIAHLEGNLLALRGYRHEAEHLRDEARKRVADD